MLIMESIRVFRVVSSGLSLEWFKRNSSFLIAILENKYQHTAALSQLICSSQS